jgi:hypothetical protein
MEIVNNWLITGFVILNNNVSVKNWVNLYKIADYMCLV